MAIPGLAGTEHIGFTVPDLDQADEFLVDVLGCQRFYTLGPYIHDDDWMQTHLRVHPRTVMKRLNFYRCGNGANFEVIEFEAADRQREQPRNSDIGGHHIALYVAEIDAAVSYLRERGVTVLDGPTSSSNASLGQRWVYFVSPWGMQFELVSFPGGKAYEATGPQRLWHPEHPGQ